jgi:hypothetical protein
MILTLSIRCGSKGKSFLQKCELLENNQYDIKVKPLAITKGYKPLERINKNAILNIRKES